MMSEENVRLQLRQPWIKFGTDAEGLDPEHATSLAHPRSYGTFPRILGKYVRDEKVLPLEEAIRKMTSAVADRLSIRDRGLLREGFHADVVVFDPRDDRRPRDLREAPSGVGWHQGRFSSMASRSCTKGGIPGRSRARSCAGRGIDGAPASTKWSCVMLGRGTAVVRIIS